jgi:hypothetical protein
MYQIIYIVNGIKETIDGLATLAQAEQYAGVLKAAGYVVSAIGLTV